MKIAGVTVDSDKLPKVPEVVQKLIASLNNGDVDMQDLARQISLEQVVTARILRVANSPLFGGQRDITTVNDAVVRLGLSTVRSLVMAAAFVTAFKSPLDFDIKAFWGRSFRMATLCKWLAGLSSSTDVDAESAFSCGMMSEIGVLVIHIINPAQACQIETLVSHGGNRLLIETTRLNYTHNDVSAALAEHWNFPESFYYALLDQADPLSSEQTNTYAGLIHLAGFLETALADGVDEEALLAGLPLDVVESAGLSLASMGDALPALKASLESANLFHE